MNKRKKSLFRISLFILAGVAFLGISLQLFFTFYYNNKIKNDIENAVNSKTETGYSLKIEKLGTNIFNQSVFISGVVLKSSKNADPSKAKYFVTVSEINLVDCSLFSFLFRKTLTISKVELVDPSGTLYRSSKKNKPATEKEKKEFSIYALLSKNFRELNIIKIKIHNAHLLVYDDINDATPSLISDDNELEVSNLKINKSIEATDRLFYADKMNLVMNRFTYTTRDSLYSFRVKQLKASYTDSTLTIDSLEMIPNYSKKQFSNEAGKQTDRISIKVAGLDFDKMNVKLFFERNWFIANQLQVKGLKLSAFRNKNYFRIEKRIKSVQELMKDIPIYVAIDDIKLTNALIVYEEISEGGTDPGMISFNKVNANISGFTSDTTLFAKYKTMELHANARFMNVGRLTAHYSFPLNTIEAVFDCSGTLTDMPLNAINTILEPGANISIQNGHVDSLIFSFHANDQKSKGSMYFYYHGLRIAFLNKKSHESGKFQDILASLAHGILIKENNPEKNKKARVTEINYERNPNRFIFSYTWKSILSGIKPAIGIPGKVK